MPYTMLKIWWNSTIFYAKIVHLELHIWKQPTQKSYNKYINYIIYKLRLHQPHENDLNVALDESEYPYLYTNIHIDSLWNSQYFKERHIFQTCYEITSMKYNTNIASPKNKIFHKVVIPRRTNWKSQMKGWAALRKFIPDT